MDMYFEHVEGSHILGQTGESLVMEFADEALLYK